MDSTAVRLVLDKLELLGQKIGMAAEQLFPYFVKQVYLDFLVAGVLAIFGWIAFSVFYRTGGRIFKETVGNNYDERPLMIAIGLTIWGLACLGATVAVVILGCRLFNVEYWAIQKILSNVR